MMKVSASVIEFQQQETQLEYTNTSKINDNWSNVLVLKSIVNRTKLVETVVYLNWLNSLFANI